MGICASGIFFVIPTRAPGGICFWFCSCRGGGIPLAHPSTLVIPTRERSETGGISFCLCSCRHPASSRTRVFSPTRGGISRGVPRLLPQEITRNPLPFRHASEASQEESAFGFARVGAEAFLRPKSTDVLLQLTIPRESSFLSPWWKTAQNKRPQKNRGPLLPNETLLLSQLPRNLFHNLRPQIG